MTKNVYLPFDNFFGESNPLIIGALFNHLNHPVFITLDAPFNAKSVNIVFSTLAAQLYNSDVTLFTYIEEPLRFEIFVFI